MGKPTIPPKCRYHDVELTLVAEDGKSSAFMAVAIANNIVNVGQGFQFNVYECPKCTYLEFHDFDPVGK